MVFLKDKIKGACGDAKSRIFLTAQKTAALLEQPLI
jgi:hypothetical protein